MWFGMVSIFIAHHEKILSILSTIEANLTSFLEEVRDLYKTNYSLLRKHAEQFLKTYETEMELHFKSEEEALFPYIKDREEVSDLINDHNWIREKIRFIRNLDVEKNPKEIVDNMTQLIDKIKEHAQKENQLFSKWGSQLSKDEIEEISRKVEEIYELRK